MSRLVPTLNTAKECNWPTCDCTPLSACHGMETLCEPLRKCQQCGNVFPLDCDCESPSEEELRRHAVNKLQPGDA